MIITRNLIFENFKSKKNSTNVKKKLRFILSDKSNEVINSLKTNYKYSYYHLSNNKLIHDIVSIKVVLNNRVIFLI